MCGLLRLLITPSLISTTNSSFIASDFPQHAHSQNFLCQTFINHCVSVVIFITNLTTRKLKAKLRKSNMSVERDENYFFYHRRTKMKERNFMFRLIKIFHKNCFSVGNSVGGPRDSFVGCSRGGQLVIEVGDYF